MTVGRTTTNSTLYVCSAANAFLREPNEMGAAQDGPAVDGSGR